MNIKNIIINIKNIIINNNKKINNNINYSFNLIIIYSIRFKVFVVVNLSTISHAETQSFALFCRPLVRTPMNGRGNYRNE